MASDAIERLAQVLGITTDLDDPEPALIAAVERAVAELVVSNGTTRDENHRFPSEGRCT